MDLAEAFSFFRVYSRMMGIQRINDSKQESFVFSVSKLTLCPVREERRLLIRNPLKFLRKSSMRKQQVYLHLGSNIGDRLAMLQKAEEMIAEQIGSIKKKSHYYETAAWGKTDQPDFINYALLVETELVALETLEAIHKIERTCGRERLEKWTARVLDIDIIFFGNEIIETKKLVVPHPHMQNRNFVLLPMMDIAGDFVHPVSGLRMGELYDRSGDELEVVLMEE